MDFVILLIIPMLPFVIGWFFGRNDVDPNANPDYYK